MSSVASTARVVVSSAFNCCCLKPVYRLGHSSPAHRVDVGRCVGFKNVWVEMASVPSSIVRSDRGVGCRSMGFFASRLLVELFGCFHFVWPFAIVSKPSSAFQRTIFNG